MTDSYLPLYRGKIRAKHGNKNVDSCSFTDRTPLKRYIYHCINILGGKKGKSNLASRLELGILPLENYMRVQSVYSFFAKKPSWPWSYGRWIYNYLYNQCISPLMLWVRISIRVKCTTLCDKVCQWLATGRWFYPGPPVSSTNITDRHDNIVEKWC